MNFNQLDIMKQITIAGNLAKLRVNLPYVPTVRRNPSNIYGVKQPESDHRDHRGDKLKEAGITLPVIDLTNNGTITLFRSGDDALSNVFSTHSVRFNGVKRGAELYLNCPISTSSDDGVIFDRFDLIGNITITGNLTESLTKLITMIKAVIPVVGGGTVGTDILSELLEGSKIADALPTDIIELIDGTKSQKNVYYVASRLINFTDYEYDENTGSRTNMPPIICETSYQNILTTYYTHDHNSTNQNRLVMEYTEITDTDNGELILSFNFNGSPILEITRVPVDVSMSPAEFIDFLVTTVPEKISESEYRSRLINQAKHLATSLEGAKPFILNEIEHARF